MQEVPQAPPHPLTGVVERRTGGGASLVPFHSRFSPRIKETPTHMHAGLYVGAYMARMQGGNIQTYTKTFTYPCIHTSAFDADFFCFSWRIFPSVHLFFFFQPVAGPDADTLSSFGADRCTLRPPEPLRGQCPLPPPLPPPWVPRVL